MEQTAIRWTFWRVANTLLCLGLNLLIERLRLDRRWQYGLWVLIAANEVRGLLVLIQSGRWAVNSVLALHPSLGQL